MKKDNNEDADLKHFVMAGVALLFLLTLSAWVLTSIDEASVQSWVDVWTVENTSVNGSLKFYRSDMDWLNQNFRIFENEWSVCMVLNSEGVLEPSSSLNTRYNETSASYAECDFMSVHNHPNGVCELSDEDKASLKNYSEKYMGVICGEDELQILDKNWTEVSYQIVRGE